MTVWRPARWITVVVVITWSAVPTAASTANTVSAGSHRTSRLGDWMTESGQREAWLGFSVGAAGDVNGDGYDDVIVGAYRWTKGDAIREGRAWAFYGSATGLSADPDWLADGVGDWAYFAHSVATAGDVNGDGYDDVIVGAPHPQEYGQAYVYYGSAGGLSTTPNWTAVSDQRQSWFGRTVRSAGDVNGDGYDDVIVGAPQYDDGQIDEGAAWVYLGSAQGLSTVAGWTAESDQAGSLFGRWVGTAGDVNADGYDDVIVGAHFFDDDQPNEGRAFAFYGSADGLSPTPDWTADGNQSGAWFGRAVATAGDVNADGFDDVIVGAPKFDHDQLNEGRAFAFYGSADGLSPTADWIAEADQADAWFGRRLSTAGDVNADGYDDVIIAAPNYDTSQPDTGKVFVYFGSPGGLLTSPNWTAQSDQAYAWFGRAVSTARDTNGDGYADVIVGAPLFDDGQRNEGAAWVFDGAAIGQS